MLDWRRRGFIGFDRHVTRSLRVGPHFRERSRQQRAAANSSGDAIPDERVLRVERPLIGTDLPASIANRQFEAHPPRCERQPQQTIDKSLSTAQVIARLNVTSSLLKRLREGHYLHAVDHEGEIRYPGWQFSNKPHRRVLPGIDIVAVAIPDSWTLAAVDAFMRSPHPALSIDGQPQTPTQWLDCGGDPTRVAAILEEMSAH